MVALETLDGSQPWALVSCGQHIGDKIHEPWHAEEMVTSVHACVDERHNYKPPSAVERRTLVHDDARGCSCEVQYIAEEEEPQWLAVEAKVEEEVAPSASSRRAG